MAQRQDSAEPDDRRLGRGHTSRRRFLKAAGAFAVGGAAVGTQLDESAADAASSDQPQFRGVRVAPPNHRYHALGMGFNQRWVCRPAYIDVVANTQEVIAAVRDARRRGLRITVRGGGHCYEDFVCGNTGGAIIDMSQMNAVSRSADGTYWLGGGCTLWNVYEDLYKRYGVTLPGGSCYSVGIGGHVAGGGYGLLSREFGLIVDYLSALEVVVVDRTGKVSAVTARRGDRRTGDLLWGHTGGGGGNFGVVTRYGFKRPPSPPRDVWLSIVAWDWASMTETNFRTLLQNYGRFIAANSAPGSRYSRLFSLLKLTHRSAGQIVLVTQVTGPDQSILDTFLAQISRGVGAPAPGAEHRRLPWLYATQTLNPSGPNQRGKYKSAYMIKPFPPGQIDAIYAALTDPAYHNPQALLQVDSYGCQINAVAPRATAVAQRSSIMKLQYQTYWTDPADDAVNLAWIRRFYNRVYASTGGTPLPNGVTDGCFVNYPDTDLSNWPLLYYKQNYRALQQVKARWDPNDVFRYRQSIRRP